MKNLFYLIILTSLALISCTEESIQKTESSRMEKSEKINYRISSSERLETFQTIEILSPLFFEIGIREIHVENIDSEKKQVSFVSTESNFKNDRYFNFKDEQFIIENNLIYEKTNPLNILKIEGNTLFYKDATTNEFINIESFYENDNISLQKLLILFNEIQILDENKKGYDDYVIAYNGRGGCHWSNQMIAYGFGFTQAGALADLQWTLNNEVNYFRCRSLNSNAEITNWGGFYTATITFCCGGSGAGGSW